MANKMVKIRSNDKKIMAQIRSHFINNESWEIPKITKRYFGKKVWYDEDFYEYRMMICVPFRKVYEYLKNQVTFTYNPEMRCIQI